MRLEEQIVFSGKTDIYVQLDYSIENNVTQLYFYDVE